MGVYRTKRRTQKSRRDSINAAVGSKAQYLMAGNNCWKTRIPPSVETPPINLNWRLGITETWPHEAQVYGDSCLTTVVS
jgi:hypothetical protein